MTADLLLTGTGNFAERILGDLALLVTRPLRVVVAARAEEANRLNWLRVAANARAAIAGRPLEVVTEIIDWDSNTALDRLIETHRPRLVVHAASLQSPTALFSGDSAWESLLRTCTLSLSVPMQAVLADRLFAAVRRSEQTPLLVNCCYPDGTNALLKALGHPVLCGAGNVAILAAAFAGELGLREPGRLKVLAHHQNLWPWRGETAPEHFPLPRVWLDGAELDDIRDRFARVRLTLGPAIPISGATGVPLFLALLEGTDWQGHAPGVDGLPGGYPVRTSDGKMALDLPEGLDRDTAIAWQLDYEFRCGLTVADGALRFHGRLAEALAAYDADLADGFALSDFPAAADRMCRLRDRLLAQPA
ncbi:hypothetical protein [Alloyangia pacifica]|uniref:Saccharopine dehydrogenase NADP binding domain-containing protein n=1 Tax=Alloyangia pacifica TaxID=311180 RepID=A0A1I6V0J3_9RHOB|nr:hypothetical protein [Alloyangia pacifica]SDI33486.1 hypothetical protein SAMN04488245_114140 [Alloyangia pacifica]SFT07251.1 hypothetical protein SAMN04488050_109189 [Alloyangia pacifica]